MEQEKSKKGLKIFFFIILILAGLIVGAYFVLAKSSIVSAQLHVESGQVFVNNQLVNGNIRLKQEDIIETKQDSLATVILYESVVINLEENTKISIEALVKKHPEVAQQSGETWNTFTQLAGVEDYTIKTGNSIASVRASAFGLKENYIIGGEGSVDYKLNGEDFIVSERRVVESIDGENVERGASGAEIQEIKEKMIRTIEELRYLRELEIKKKPVVYNILKSKTGFSDEEIKDYLNDLDEGKIDVDELVKQSPVKLESIQKAVEITKFIQKINEQLKLYE